VKRGNRRGLGFRIQRRDGREGVEEEEGRHHDKG
jgi:hypothetical protein